MIESIQFLDEQCVLWINGLNNHNLDEFMWWVSARITWVPVYLILIAILFRFFNVKQAFMVIGLIALAVIASDLISVYGFKQVFMRLRPSHNSNLEPKLHFYLQKNGELYKGGDFGFVSSHAANFAAIGTVFWLKLKDKIRFLGAYTIVLNLLVRYSRMYLGVHYLTDVIVGAMVGFSVAFLLCFFSKKKIV